MDGKRLNKRREFSMLDDIFSNVEERDDSMFSLFAKEGTTVHVVERSMTLTAREERKLVREYIRIISDEG